MKKVDLKIKDSGVLLKFLKRFSTIESSLLVEIKDNTIVAKTYTPERSVVKYSSESLEDIFENADDLNIDNLKFGLYNINKFINAFKHFGVDDCNMVINIDDLDGEKIGTSINLKNKKLNIKFDCASIKIFTYITDEIMEKVTDISEFKSTEIELTKDKFNEISSLFAIDVDDKLFTFNIGKGINLSSKSFDFNMSDEQVEDKFKITCYKSHFNLADKEDSILVISEEKLVLKSNESNTICVVSSTDN